MVSGAFVLAIRTGAQFKGWVKPISVPPGPAALHAIVHRPGREMRDTAPGSGEDPRRHG